MQAILCIMSVIFNVNLTTTYCSILLSLLSFVIKNTYILVQNSILRKI